MAATVLIVDDSPQIRGEIKKALLDAGLDVGFVEAENGAHALKILTAGVVDVVLCDVQMPVMDGFTFLRMFRSLPGTEATPVIMLTGRDNSEEKIFGLESGATDYVTKPFIAGELVARVKVQLKLKGLQDELRVSTDRFKALSNTDYLTGLYNRRHFSELLEQEFARVKRYKYPISLVMIDIDHFKRINDQHGHAAGDAVLVEMAGLMRRWFRESDVLARYGGEEFIVLLPQTQRLDAKAACEKVRAACEGAEISTFSKGQITFSAGVSSSETCPAVTAEKLINKADAALYRAKETGRNRTVVDETAVDESREA